MAVQFTATEHILHYLDVQIIEPIQDGFIHGFFLFHSTLASKNAHMDLSMARGLRLHHTLEIPTYGIAARHGVPHLVSFIRRTN